MYTLKLTKNYKSKLSLRDTQRAIVLIKSIFEKELKSTLNLERVSAPIIVEAKSGINDELSGVERVVRFDIAKNTDVEAEIVQSLAKWKRVALYEYGFKVGEGLYTDMNAIRRDDDIDNIHSIYVDQWDWEFVIEKRERTIIFLKSIVQKIVDCIVKAQEAVRDEFKCITTNLEREVFFITSQELLDMYPNCSASEREHLITKEKRTVFIMQIGGALNGGAPSHGSRAPDYDDWQLNGDILLWNDVLNEPLEISSMGIRVDADSMAYQLDILGKTEKAELSYHKAVLNNIYPLTIGGGIGQSRLCMLLLQKLHIGEVQASVWPKDMLEKCREAGIRLL